MTSTSGRILATPSTMGDDEQLLTTTLFEHAARSYGDQRIIHRIQDGTWRTTNYGEVWERIKCLASGLQSLGVGPGGRVGVLAWNDLRHLEAYFAIPMIGATMVQLNLRLAPQDLAYVMRHAEVTHLIVDRSLLELAETVAAHVPELETVIIGADADIPAEWIARDEVFSYETLLDQHAPVVDLPNLDERTASAACYTTGTTGKPKGVFYSHRSVWLHSMAMAGNLGVTLHDTVMLLTPMFHAQCWGLPYTAAAVGARMVLPGRFTIKDMDLISDAMEAHQVTVAPAAPAILMPLAHYFESLEVKPDLRGLKLLCGASEPSVTLMRELFDYVGMEVVQGYGATETSPNVAMNRLRPEVTKDIHDDDAWELRRAQGLPVVGIDIKIVDPTGAVLPAGQGNIGEICLRGPWVTSSYHNNPDANEKSFDAEGYWRSGDLGFIDENGYVKVTDRLKDVIKSGGEWISSLDMENQIASISAVADVAVIGIPHPKWEERPLAIVLPKDGLEVSETEIYTLLRAHFAEWQLPDQIHIVDEIPRTSVGKINKKSLREEYAQMYSARA